MSKAADWQVIQGPTYAQYSAEFRRNAEQLASMAKKKQIDSAALSYMQVTMTCINCHKYVKNAKVAQGEQLSPQFEVALKQDAALIKRLKQ
jgi:CRISPR/Cas system-associated protein Cas10 (large subunit of type III CRISPR-Cas system)